MTHGEAVAAGMVMAAELSGLGEAETQRLRELIICAGLPVAPPDIGAEEMLRTMGRDKKVQGKSLRFVLLRELGEAYVTDQFDEATLYNICEASA